MTVDNRRLLDRAQNGLRESASLEFKRSLDPTSTESLCEVIKDIIAFANSGGGVMVFGVDDHGQSCSEIQAMQVLTYDIADLTNRIAKYTGYQFADIEIIEVTRGDIGHAAFLIGDGDVPIVFTKPGTYDAGNGKQKTAFAQGTIYFRHGAKSEPGNRDDLLKWRDRAIAQIRDDWLSGIRKVVEAPEGHIVTVIPSDQNSDFGAPVSARITNDPNAPRFVPHNAEEIWPFRQKELLRQLNEALKPARALNSHDLFCVNWRFDILGNHPEFVCKPHKFASPQYSKAFVDWIIFQVKSDPLFFDNCRQLYKTKERDFS